jgi:DNA-binding NarL/FixJ family response regulator
MTVQTISGHLNIAVILNHSLLAKGIACKLMEFASTVSLSVVDSTSPDLQQTLQSHSPEAIIIDSGDSELSQTISLKKLFEWAPEAKIICLDHSTDLAHVFTSQEIEVASAEQLLHIIQPNGSGQ